MIELVILIAAVVAASWYWSKRNGFGVTSQRPGGARPEGRGPLASALDRWTAAGLITLDQSRAIVAFEQREAGPPRRIPLITEALAYVGAVLAIAGGGVAIAQVWEDMSPGAHVALLGVLTGVVFLGGWLAKPSHEPAFQRLVDVLWVLSLGGLVATMVVLFAEVFDLDGRDVALGATLVAAGWAGMLYAIRRRGVELLALVAAVHAAVISSLAYPAGDEPLWLFAAVVWALGAIVATIGWRRMLHPAEVALPVGALGMLFAPSIAAGEYGWLLAVGIVTAAGAMGFSVWARHVPVLVFGSVAMFGYVTATVVRYLGDQFGVPTALAVAGALILAMAVGVARLFKATTTAPPDGTMGEEHREPPMRAAS